MTALHICKNVARVQTNFARVLLLHYRWVAVALQKQSITMSMYNVYVVHELYAMHAEPNLIWRTSGVQRR